MKNLSVLKIQTLPEFETMNTRKKYSRVCSHPKTSIMVFLNVNSSIIVLLIATFIVSISCDEFTYKLTINMVNNGFNVSDLHKESYNRADLDEIAEQLLKQNSVQFSPKTPEHVNNLNSILQHFGDNKCLIVINNFVNTNIQTNIAIPIVLRQFGLAVSNSELQTDNRVEKNILWTPSKFVPQIMGNFTTNALYEFYLSCHISEYFTPTYFFLWRTRLFILCWIKPNYFFFHIKTLAV